MIAEKQSRAKARKHADAQTSGQETTRINLSLGSEQYQRLYVHALMSGDTASKIVSDLITSHLKVWALPANLTARSVGKDRLAAPTCGDNSIALEANLIQS